MSTTETAHSQKLVTMARQIADFFRPYPEEQAVKSVAEHINKFWTRRMRDELLAMPGLREGAIDPLVAKAAAMVKTGPSKLDATQEA